MAVRFPFPSWFRFPVACLLLGQAALVAQPPVTREQPLSPADSLAQLQLHADFQVQLIAHEPQVIDPVDAVFDDRGRLWVVEMRDYPYRVGETPAGRIRILIDSDLDGVFDQSRVFADQLEMPTGIALWKDGVVVTLAGQLVWMRDTDGDSTVDTQQVWIEGFSKDNEQLRANHPRLGPDGKWYIASGLRGGNVVAGPDFRVEKTEPIALGSRDVRFDPATKTLEAITGPAQFGLCFDSLGQRLFCSNRNPATMARFEQEDLSGNALAGMIPSIVDVIPAGEQSHVYPIVNAWTTSNLHAGQFTAACGVFYHEFDNQVTATEDRNDVQIFACEPTGSLVHRSSFSPWVAASNRRADVAEVDPPREWLASRDEWFRPVNVLACPDGGVVVLDMHRAVIEHPAWVPDELKHRRDERWGNEAGRILHLTTKHAASDMSLATALRELHKSPLGGRTSSELVKLVASSNPWLRETARRLLIERNDPEQVGALELAVLDNSNLIAGRTACLYLASVLRKSPSPVCLELLRGTSEPELQIVALRVLRTGGGQTASELEEAVVKVATASRNATVLRESLLTLGSSKSFADSSQSVPAPLLVALENAFANNSADTAELLVAAGSALRNHPHALLTAWTRGLLSQPEALARDPQPEASARDRSAIPLDLTFVSAATKRLTNIAISDKKIEPAELLAIAIQSVESENVGSRVAGLAILSELMGRSELAKLASQLELPEIWGRVVALAKDESQPLAGREQAILLLARSPRAADRALLPELTMRGDAAARAIGLRAWATTSDAACDDYLLGSLASSSPQLKGTIIELVGQKPARMVALVGKLSAGELTAKQIGALELKKLVTRAKEETKQQLEAALESIVNSDRSKVIADYQACLKLANDPSRGKQIFIKHCASCHKIGNDGVQVGPDISDSRTQQPSQLLTNILDPNRAIDNNYFRFVALTKDEQIFEGIIAEETNEAIILRGQNNVRHVLQRADLEELKATGVSMMPEGIEAQIDQQGMADLIAYIKGWRYLGE